MTENSLEMRLRSSPQRCAYEELSSFYRAFYYIFWVFSYTQDPQKQIYSLTMKKSKSLNIFDIAMTNIC